MSTNSFLALASGVITRFTPVVASSGAGDGNKIAMLDSNGQFHLSVMPPGVGAATETILASENLAAGDFVNIWNNTGTRNVRKADASNARAAHGFVLAAVTSGQNATVHLSGTNTALTGLTPGARYFLSSTTAGVATGVATAPNTTGQILQYLGIADDVTEISFNDNGYIQL